MKITEKNVFGFGNTTLGQLMANEIYISSDIPSNIQHSIKQKHKQGCTIYFTILMDIPLPHKNQFLNKLKNTCKINQCRDTVAYHYFFVIFTIQTIIHMQCK